MSQLPIACSWIEGDCILQAGKKIQISIVAYEHQAGMPARFCTGLVPATALSKQLASIGVTSTIRVIDPTPIANYCNGWETKKTKFKKVISNFMIGHEIDFFFDESEEMSESTIELLREVGEELETSTDAVVLDMVQRIKESGMKHGGESGASNAILYMAAHPFSWLEMYHPLVWSRRYSSEELHCVNLMSKPEARFAVIRKFLQERRPDLCSGINPVDHYMTVCNTPCYIPLEGEPMFADLTSQGYERCHQHYQALKSRSSNHKRALKDFESLMRFLEQGGA